MAYKYGISSINVLGSFKIFFINFSPLQSLLS